MKEKAEKTTPEITLDRKSKILFVFLGLLIVGSVAVTYYKYMVQRNYIVQAATDCDPESEACFVWECDPESIVEGEACTGVPDNDIWFYKNIERNASRMPLCDPNDENCDALVCGENEPDCQEILCTEENVPEGETCNNPEEYLLENPPEEECEEDDEECLAEQEAAECEEGDEECLAEEEGAECAPKDEKCLAEEETAECESDDPADCEEALADEETNGNAEIPDEEEDTGSEVESDTSPGDNTPPPGFEPM